MLGSPLTRDHCGRAWREPTQFEMYNLLEIRGMLHRLQSGAGQQAIPKPPHAHEVTATLGAAASAQKQTGVV